MSDSKPQFIALTRGKYGEERERQEHPCFGQLGFTRTSGTSRRLYGSSITHQNTITLEISQSEKIRDLHQTWYFPREEIIRVEMSQTQFAEAISTMGSSPIPVTIRRLQGKSTPPCPEENVREKFVKEFKKKINRIMDDMGDDFKTARKILEQPGTMKMADRKAISKLLDRLEMEMRSNVPFTHSQFNEAVDNTVTEAKGEIEAFFEGKIRSLGLEAAKGILLDTPPELCLDAPVRNPVIEIEKIERKIDDPLS